MQHPDQLLMQLTMSLSRVARSYRFVADRLAAGFGLSQATAWPIVIMGRLGDGVRPGMLADALGLEPSSLVRIIDNLVEAGLLERREDCGDRRAKTLHLTAAGKRCAAQLEKALHALRRDLFKEAERDDIAACMRVLDSLGGAIAQSVDKPGGGNAA